MTQKHSTKRFIDLVKKYIEDSSKKLELACRIIEDFEESSSGSDTESSSESEDGDLYIPLSRGKRAPTKKKATRKSTK